MDRRVIVLSHPLARRNASHLATTLPDGWVAKYEPPKKSRNQEELYHALFQEIARTREFMGQRQDAETWKRLLVDAFARLKAEDGEPLPGHGRVVPNLDGTGVVQLGVQTRNFTKKQANEFIEFLHAWMSVNEEVA